MLALALVLAFRASALAEDIDTNPEADELQQQIEQTAKAYDEAKAAVAAAEDALDENRERIAELERAIPAQQARSDAAARELYKLQQQRVGIVELLLGAEDFYGFLANWEYVDRVTTASIAEITRLSEMRAELEQSRSALLQAKREAEEGAASAEQALKAAQEARVEAQRRARESAQQISEADTAARNAVSQQDASSAAGDSGETGSQPAGPASGTADSEAASSGSPSESGAAADPSAATDSAADEAPATGGPAAEEAADDEPATETLVDDDADWTSDEEEFVSEWAERIDDYLDGSPMAGQGSAFAQAAWDYGVDPRWSPAISYTESSIGRYCFLPYNAWGWGSASWSSWEEAIDAHVCGLARGYGYTISEEAAKKYCPPTWQSWYSTTLAQMNLI